MVRPLFLTLLALILLSAYPANAERRLALVVGVAEYRELPGIVRSAADARAVSLSLTELGFQSDLVLEPDGRALDEAVERFTSSLGEGDVALFYFAGHAARIRGEFTLLPADAPPLGTRAEEGRGGFGMALHDLVDEIKAAGARAQVIIIDACRGDPYAGDGRELAPSSCGDVGQQLAEGTVALFSASSGQKALDRLGPDDRNAHSVFTRVLLPQFRQPRSITRIARSVRDEVVEVAAGVRYEQRPAYLDELTGPPVVLAPRSQEAAVAPIPGPSLELPPAEPRPPRGVAGMECGSVSPGPPAFDCRSARRIVEVAICRDPRLGSCDRVLNVIFYRAQEVVGRGASRLRQEEDAWVARRDTCAEVAGQGPDALVSCIHRAYEERIAELQQIVGSPPPSAAQTPSFNCAGARTRVEQTICTDAALAAKDRQMTRLYANAARASEVVVLNQREWLAARDQCNRLDGGELRACTHRAYDVRIRELRNPVAIR